MKMKKMTTLLILLQAASALPALASAPSTAPRQAKIQGTVEFVQRKGIAPMTMASMNYWSVIVHGSGMDYELPTVLGIDSGSRPDLASIRGAHVRPGDEVSVEGKVNPIRKGFAVVSEVSNIEIR
jgi:hypothetical protein